MTAFLSDAEGNIPLDSELWPLHEGRTAMALKTMPIAKLLAVKRQVEAAISAKLFTKLI
jgi:hypothetical protein